MMLHLSNPWQQCLNKPHNTAGRPIQKSRQQRKHKKLNPSRLPLANLPPASIQLRQQTTRVWAKKTYPVKVSRTLLDTTGNPEHPHELQASLINPTLSTRHKSRSDLHSQGLFQLHNGRSNNELTWLYRIEEGAMEKTWLRSRNKLKVSNWNWSNKI